MKSNLKKMLIIGASLLVVVTIDSFVMAEENTDGAVDIVLEESSNESELQANLNEAVSIFYERFPGAEIDEIDIELRRNETYEIDIDGFDSEYEYELEFRTHPLEIVDEERDRDNDRERPLDLDALISVDEATDIALERAGFGVVTEWNLDSDDGWFIWELEIEDRESYREAEVEIDAESGQIVEFELD